MTANSRSISFPSEGAEIVALLRRPPDARALFVFAHGAGAGMHHAFMEATAEALAARRIATLRYEFPYMTQKRGYPDRPKVLDATVRAALARGLDEGLPLFAGGKSMGGRMTSQSLAAGGLDAVRGVCFLGFPLHPPKKPSVTRGAHLESVKVPMLFLQGTRDDLAELSLLTPICARLGARATLHVIEGANHAFEVPKKSGRTHADVIDELATTIDRFCETTLGAP